MDLSEPCTPREKWTAQSPRSKHSRLIRTALRDSRDVVDENPWALTSADESPNE